MQLYTLSEPIYGPESYTTVGKKIDVPVQDVHEPEKVQEGSGLDESETTETSSIPEKIKDNDVLNELNEKSKGKLDSKIYQSFLHPNQIKTGSISLGVGVKRKTEDSKTNETKKKASDNNSTVKHKFHLI